MLGTVPKIVLYIMVSVVYGIIYAILMRLPKKLRAIIMTIVLIITVIAVGAYAYSQASPQEIAQSKIFAAQQLKHFKYCDDYLQCLEKGGFGKSELVYEIKNDDFLLHVVVGLCWGRSRMTPLFVSFCKVSDFPLKSGAFDILILAGWMC